MNTKQTNAWDFDVRIRDRNFAKTTMDDKEYQKYLAQLPDLAEQVEPIGVPQPALGGRES